MRDPRGLLSDPSKSDDADVLACQLHKRAYPIAPVFAAGPVAATNAVMMSCDVVGQLEQQCKHELRDGCSSVGGDVRHDDVLLAGGIDVDHVVARRENADVL